MPSATKIKGLKHSEVFLKFGKLASVIQNAYGSLTFPKNAFLKKLEGGKKVSSERSSGNQFLSKHVLTMSRPGLVAH